MQREESLMFRTRLSRTGLKFISSAGSSPEMYLENTLNGIQAKVKSGRSTLLWHLDCLQTKYLGGREGLNTSNALQLNTGLS